MPPTSELAHQAPQPPPVSSLASSASEQTGRVQQPDCSSSPSLKLGETDQHQQQQQQQQLQLEHAEQEDQLSPLPAVATVAPAPSTTQTSDGEPAAVVVHNLATIIDDSDVHEDDEGSVSVSGELQQQQQPELGADSPAGEEREQQQFNRLDPSRRSFSSPSVNLLQQHQQQQQQQQQQQTSSPSVGRTIFGRLTKATHSDRQQRLVSSKSSDASEKLRRRTALGLIPLPVASTKNSGSTQAVTTSWRSWLFNNNHQNHNSSTSKFSLRSTQKQASSSNRTPQGRQEQQQQQQINNSNRKQQLDEHVDLSSNNNNHSSAKTVAAATDVSQAQGWAHATKQTAAAAANSGCLLSMKSIKGSSGSNNSDQATNENQKMMINNNQNNSPAASQVVGGQPLVDRLIDSQLDWRQLVRDANGGDASLNQLSELQIKRQEVIHELVQTERHHCLTLALMRQVYLAGLRRLNESRAAQSFQSSKQDLSKSSIDLTAASQQQQDLIDLERLFPALEDLIQAHELFFAHLRLRLLDSCTPISQQQQQHQRRPFLGFVGPLGDLLCDQFRLSVAGNQTNGREDNRTPGEQHSEQQNQTSSNTTTNGQKLLQAYGKFCGSHFDSSKYYKQLMHNDKGFRQFIESCNKQNPACRQRGIPECNLLVTQRLTKYPLLLEQLIKTSKDESEEEQEKLRGALKNCKCLLAELNQQLARKESFERLLDIYAHFCPKSYTLYNRHLRFTKHDLLQHKRVRQLVHCDGQVRIWSATRRKLFQVLCLILNDIIVFLRFEPSAIQSSPLDSNLADPSDSPLSLVPSSASSLINPQSGGSQSSQGQQQDQQQQQQQSQPSQPSFRYYFANIDNKSSVISLSKLLIREKAAHDQEPRIYLISSNPRQPEMYELAFVSKRHQSGFVEKLKSCIEQHNKKLALDDDDLDSSLYHHYQDEQEDESGDEMIELNLEDCECCAICSQHEDQDEEEDEDEEIELDVSLLDAARRGSPSRANCRNTKSKSLRQKKQQEQQRRRDTIGGYELDLRSSAESPSSQEEQDDEHEEASSFVYTASTVAAAAGEPKQQQEQDLRLSGRESTSSGEDSHQESSEEDKTGPPLESTADSGLSERAKDSLDEAAPSKQKLRGTNRRRRAQRPRNVSNQSSSSSEAAHRQAIELISVCKQLHQQQQQQQPASNEDDEFDSGRGHDDSCCSSSTASSSGSNSLDSRATNQKQHQHQQQQQQQQQVSCKTQDDAEGAAVGHHQQQQIDLKSSLTSALSDEGSPRASAPTSSGNGSDASSQLVVVVAPAAATGEQQILVSATNRAPHSSLDPSSCNSSVVGANPGAAKALASARAAASLRAADNGDGLIKCSSVAASDNIGVEGGKSCCCCSSPSSSLAASKQRKLSNVSSMSSQLKLISRLKSGLEAAGGSSLARRVSSSSKSSSCHHHNHNHHSHRHSATQPCDTAALATLSKQMRQQMRRSSFVPEQKLEELRDLRIQLDKDKQEWQAKFNRMQEQLLNERRELDLAREKLKQDRQQVVNEREQLYRKLDALKEKGILLSPSHKVIITAAPEQQPLTTNRLPQMKTVPVNQQQVYCIPSAQNGFVCHQTTALRQPTGLVRQGNNSIRIHQHSQLQQVNGEMMPPRLTATANQVTTTNLFIQSSRVPLHLSENSPPQASPVDQHCKQTTLSRVTTPLISVIGNNLFGGERLTGGTASQRSPSSATHQPLESHVI